jgi:hypothetical protein
VSAIYAGQFVIGEAGLLNLYVDCVFCTLLATDHVVGGSVVHKFFFDCVPFSLVSDLHHGVGQMAQGDAAMTGKYVADGAAAFNASKDGFHMVAGASAVAQFRDGIL